VPLKYQSWSPYSAMGSTYVLYKRCLCTGDRPLIELPSIFMLLMVEIVRATEVDSRRFLS